LATLAALRFVWQADSDDARRGLVIGEKEAARAVTRKLIKRLAR